RFSPKPHRALSGRSWGFHGCRARHPRVGWLATMDHLLERERPAQDAWASQCVVTPDTTRPAQMAKVFDYVKGSHATHLMALGRRLGLFEHLAAHPSGMQPDTLAEALGLHAPYVRQWCETACALELLDYDPAAGYSLAPFMDEI